ncbi:MAG: hypothetical protein AAF938_00535 [Myxococcota bacterium]
MKLEDVDRAIKSHGGGRSLAPDRTCSTPLCELAGAIGTASDACFRDAFADALGRVALAQLEAFPENLFWDLDALAHSMAEHARQQPNPKAALADLADQVERLQARFGSASPIRFRYVHDFIYGFDQCTWIRRGAGGPDAKRAPAGSSNGLTPTGAPERHALPPFHPAFLAYQLARGEELLALIDADDQKYPRLPDGTPRNPFGFSRSPEDEARLFRTLAKEDLLPIRAWEAAPAVRADRDYRAVRRDVAGNVLPAAV